MCKDCGCEEAGKQHHTHRHADGTVHTHVHDETAHDHAPATRTVTVEQRVLAHNDEIAAQNRAWLKARGIVALNLISSPGTGKTLLLEKTVERLKARIGVAVITGDQQTDNDKRRIARTGVPVEQIETHDACHLDAARVAGVLPVVVRPDTKLLFIENVGNLVCPAAFDLGENFQVALLSTTEGEDKPQKYPALFSRAGVVVLTKMDLAPHLEWDLAACRRTIQGVHPGVFVFEVSAKTGAGMDAWCDYLLRLVG
ncbi:MAG: hydrogenase nickel incorporation protein HypB [Kiritimatiellia bacterium]